MGVTLSYGTLADLYQHRLAAAGFCPRVAGKLDNCPALLLLMMRGGEEISRQNAYPLYIYTRVYNIICTIYLFPSTLLFFIAASFPHISIIPSLCIFVKPFHFFYFVYMFNVILVFFLYILYSRDAGNIG